MVCDDTNVSPDETEFTFKVKGNPNGEECAVKKKMTLNLQ